MRILHLSALALPALLSTSATVLSAQILETETARLLPRGRAKVEMGYEHQTSSEGIEAAVPLAVEYGITNRLELLVEPIFYATVRPKNSRHVTGPGDLEATVTYLLREESQHAPAFAAAFEVKVPTAKDPLIGTGETDYTAYLIGSRRRGRLDTHAHFGYTLNGAPPGTTLRDVWSFGLATEFHRTAAFEIYAEALGSTASAPAGGSGDSGNPNVLVPEAADGELTGSVGVAYRPARNFRMSLGFTYDNTNALQIRPGFTIWMR